MDIAETVRSVFNWFKPDAFEKTMNVYFGVEVGDFVKNGGFISLLIYSW